MAWKGIIGQNFTPESFLEYVRGLVWNLWQPDFIVLHHTAVPSLSQRANGFNSASMSGLQRYYRDELGWSAGPHLFVDDQPAGIWVFTPLTTPGVHAKSFNGRSLGLEMLGNYDVENFDSGRGARVRDNAVVAIAILTMALGIATIITIILAALAIPVTILGMTAVYHHVWTLKKGLDSSVVSLLLGLAGGGGIGCGVGYGVSKLGRIGASGIPPGWRPPPKKSGQEE
jgi:hypothetical protein